MYGDISSQHFNCNNLFMIHHNIILIINITIQQQIHYMYHQLSSRTETLGSDGKLSTA